MYDRGIIMKLFKTKSENHQQDAMPTLRLIIHPFGLTQLDPTCLQQTISHYWADKTRQKSNSLPQIGPSLSN